MNVCCPYRREHEDPLSDGRNVVRNGRYRRTSDGQYEQKYLCKDCESHFSSGTFKLAYGQKKRQLNHDIFRDYSSGLTQRRLAFNLGTTRKTVARKIVYVAARSARRLESLLTQTQHVVIMEFDDMETYEHTKMKPLSISLAVESGTRRILDFEVSEMPARSQHAKKAREKYGPRKDQRKAGRKRLFERLSRHVAADAIIKSDQNPHYPPDVKEHFPQAEHKAYKGRKPRNYGHDELKKGWDPLFSLNHTAAMIRANMSRLVRKTWTTSKTKQGLINHLLIYAHFHNDYLLPKIGRRYDKWLNRDPFAPVT